MARMPPSANFRRELPLRKHHRLPLKERVALTYLLSSQWLLPQDNPEPPSRTGLTPELGPAVRHYN